MPQKQLAIMRQIEKMTKKLVQYDSNGQLTATKIATFDIAYC